MSVPTYFVTSNSRLANILTIIRLANARYQRVAEEIRCNARRSHHARRYACKIGLKINIARADNCPQSAISYQPLPVLDQAGSPEAHPSFRAPHIASIPQVRKPVRPRPTIPPIVIPAAGSLRRHAHIQSPISTSLITMRALPNPNDVPSDVSATSTPPSLFSLSEDIEMPSAPVLRPRELPDLQDNDHSWMNDVVFSAVDLSPQASSYGSSLASSDSVQTPSRDMEIVLHIKLPAKRKYLEEEIEIENFQPPKQQMKSRWTTANRKSAIRNPRRHSRRASRNIRL